MIPQAYITDWAQHVPWQTNEQVEQDLVISRALVEIFSDKLLAKSLAFRGGTALHKLYLLPQSRFSEDIDLVQIKAEPFGPIMDRLRERLQFLGTPRRKQKEHNNTLVYSFDSEFPPTVPLKLKIETNCREHFSVLGFKEFPFEVDSPWFKSACNLTTYSLEELLGTKLRALYQRRKGRDLYDIYKAISQVSNLKIESIIRCYHEYMAFSVEQPPTQKLYLQNMEAKMQDDEFKDDIVALIRPIEKYSQEKGYQLVKKEIMGKM